MPLDQLSGIFIVSAFIRYTNTPDFFFFFFFLRGAPDWHSGLVVKYYVLKCLCLSSGQCFWSPLPLGPIPDQDPGNVRHLRRVSGAARRFSLKVKLKKVRQKKGGTHLQFRTHFSIRQEIYCRLSIVRCWQIPHIFHIRPPETWGCFNTQGTSSTDSFFFFLTPGARAEMNRISILFFFFFFLSRKMFSLI